MELEALGKANNSMDRQLSNAKQSPQTCRAQQHPQVVEMGVSHGPRHVPANPLITGRPGPLLTRTLQVRLARRPWIATRLCAICWILLQHAEAGGVHLPEKIIQVEGSIHNTDACHPDRLFSRPPAPCISRPVAAACRSPQDLVARLVRAQILGLKRIALIIIRKPALRRRSQQRQQAAQDLGVASRDHHL